MAKKKSHHLKSILNRRARFDYELGDSLVVGIQLTGAETKAVRLGQAQLSGAYVTIKDGELWLLNAVISDSKGSTIIETERSRKLLAKKREIADLIAAKTLGKTILPLEILYHGRYIKLRIAVGRGKKLYDKRRTIKKRDEQRQIKQLLG